MVKIEDYKQYTIEFENGLFTAYKEGQHVASSKEYEALKTELDKMSKRSFGQKVIYMDRSGFVEATVTSMRERKSSIRPTIIREFRVTFKREDNSMSWSDVGVSRLIKNTIFNKTKIDDAARLKDEIKGLEDKHDLLIDSLERYTEAELLGEA
jgi:hypothetical protein